MDLDVGRVFTEGMNGWFTVVSKGGVAVDLLRLLQFVEISGCYVNRYLKKIDVFLNRGPGIVRKSEIGSNGDRDFRRVSIFSRR